jgi:ABC-type Fe3+ transport system permease subunit
MTAYIGYHHGLLQGAIFGAIALLVIVLGILTYRRWVARSENRHILRGDEERRSDQGYGDPKSHGV